MIDIPDSILPKDGKGNTICPKCKATLERCTCPSYDPNKPKAENYDIKIKVDKAGRHGKSVIVISGLPPQEKYLKSLSRKLKNKCASGGTYYVEQGKGVIEVQGHNADLVHEILTEEGIILE